jgi:5-methylcytosine-specific restriction endonuclease McrA
MKKRAPEQVKQAVRRFVAEGWSRAAISRWLGISTGTVASWCDPELAAKRRESSEAWRNSANGQAYFKQRRKEDWQRHRSYYQEKNRAYHQTEEAKAKRKVYRQENAGLLNYHTAKRHAQKLQATPPWLTEEQKAEIRAIYVECRRLQEETGIAHNVDHIHPLQGSTVCGLHVPWNLQILTESENCAKKNSLNLTAAGQ